MENLKRMKECLTSIVEEQIYGNLDKVDTKELGEAVDMIKDLSEAIYYCTITDAMEKQPKNEGDSRYYTPPRMYEPYEDEEWRPMHYKDGMISRYSDGRVSYSMYNDKMPHTYRDGMMMKDPREGRSGERRKMYMDGKHRNDKTHQMQELEAYLQDLATDITEMVEDASPEEKQLLQNKISILAAKVK